MNAREVKEYVDEVLKDQFVLTVKRNKDCEYLRNNKCIATTQTSCVRCRSFSPGYLAKMKKLADLYQEARDAKEELRIAKSEIDHLNTCLADMRVESLKRKETRYVYGMRQRGYSPGAQPDTKNIIGTKPDPDGNYYDILIYDKALTQKQIEDYALDFLGEQ